jgi:hypothetical protein
MSQYVDKWVELRVKYHVLRFTKGPAPMDAFGVRSDERRVKSINQSGILFPMPLGSFLLS